MAWQASEQQCSDTTRDFCVECRKIDFQKLAQFGPNDISEFDSRVLLGHMAKDPDATQDIKSNSKCWLCIQRYIAFLDDARECLLCVADVTSTVKRYDLESKTPSLPGTAPCLCFVDTKGQEFSFAWVNRYDAPSGFIIHRPITQFLDVSFVQDCITLCQKNHGTACNEVSQYVQRMKLLDCYTTEIIQITSPVSYVTLSYVWAKEREGAVEKRIDGSLEFKSLSQTIQDSIITTCRLGYRYLWVDKLCIDQTDSIEKHEQVMQMDKIYAGAELTIIAAAGNDEEFGLPGVTSRSRIRPKTRETVDFGSVQIVPFEVDHIAECRSSKWNTRGWTLQEGLLSKRRLYFTEIQAIFECKECSIPESLYQAEPQTTKVDDNVSRIHFGSRETILLNYSGSLQYTLLVNEFSCRSLSNEADSFSAFAGIAGYFSKLEPPIFNFCGIPIQFTDRSDELSLDATLARGLIWCHSSYQPNNLSNLGAPYRRLACPSWTWAGWCGELEFMRYLWKGYIMPLITLEGVGFRNGDMMSSKSLVEGGTVRSLDASRVWALHVSAMLLCPEAVSICYVKKKIKIAGEEVIFDMSEKMEHAAIFENVLSGELRFLALVAFRFRDSARLRVFFMVVKKIDESYCRVGTMNMPLRNRSSLKEAREWVVDQAETCSIKLI
ncbi:Nn.00g028440.m01.CDS01 [Neocucurbitaria sp. VM-36]